MSSSSDDHHPASGASAAPPFPPEIDPDATEESSEQSPRGRLPSYEMPPRMRSTPLRSSEMSTTWAMERSPVGTSVEGPLQSTSTVEGPPPSASPSPEKTVDSSVGSGSEAPRQDDELGEVPRLSDQLSPDEAPPSEQEIIVLTSSSETDDESGSVYQPVPLETNTSALAQNVATGDEVLPSGSETDDENRSVNQPGPLETNTSIMGEILATGDEVLPGSETDDENRSVNQPEPLETSTSIMGEILATGDEVLPSGSDDENRSVNQPEPLETSTTALPENVATGDEVLPSSLELDVGESSKDILLVEAGSSETNPTADKDILPSSSETDAEKRCEEEEDASKDAKKRSKEEIEAADGEPVFKDGDDQTKYARIH